MKAFKQNALRFVCAILLFGMFGIAIFAKDPKTGVYSKNVRATKKIALTFDDGPHPRYTEKILEILDRYQVTATFFMIGVNVKNYPETFQKIIASGCEIGNHTYSHHKVNEMNDSDLTQELISCEQAIVETGGSQTKLFRPPQGAMSDTVKATAQRMGYSIVLWSIDTKDWAHNPPKEIYRSVLESLKDGDIILMHDYISGSNTTCEALEMIIPTLLSKGYEFVTVSQLIEEEDTV